MHSLPRDRASQDKSGRVKKPTERSALTNWRPHREGHVRTRKETDRARRTHLLEIAQRAKSGHGKKPTERGPLTYWRPHREGQVRTRKETDRARHTHKLETAQGGTSQNTERNRQSDVHSRSGDRTERDKLGQGKKSTERGVLTYWRPHREGQVRTQKEKTERDALTNWRPPREGQVRTRRETERARHTHVLETTQGDKSGHGKKPTERGTLTNWRPHREGQVRDTERN